ncbi:MAG: transposase, partial [Clostridium sp.]
SSAWCRIGITTIEEVNEFLNSYIKEFNEKFALPLHNIKSVFETQPLNEKINVTLAVLCDRTVDTGHCLRHDNRYYKMLDKKGLQVHYRKGTKTMLIQAFDGNKYCCVNDTDIYALECIPEHEAKSKDLDLDYKKPEPKKQYIPPMNHPWRKSIFGKFVKKQEHHWNDDEKVSA